MSTAVKMSATLIASSLFAFSMTATQPAAAASGLHQVTPGSPCTDVFVLGARGSGQDLSDTFGLGPEVYAGVEAYAAQLSGYDVGFDFLSYPAQDVSTLYFPGTKTSRMFYDGLDEGVRQTLWELGVRADKCPTERFVLAGYSQGAMVMRRTLLELANRAVANTGQARDILPRIDGILAIADGDRYPDQGGVSYDDAPSSFGVWWVGNTVKKVKVSYASTKGIPDSVAWPSNRFHSVCHSGDLVCDNTGVKTVAIGAVAAGMVHGNAYKPGGAAADSVAEAARSIAETSKSLNPKTPTCSVETSCTPWWVGYTWSEILTDPSMDVAASEWITPIPGAELRTISLGLRVMYTPSKAGTYPWAVRITLADGTTRDVSGILIAYDFPPPIHKIEYTLDYAAPNSTVTVYLSKVVDSPRYLTQMTIEGGFYNDPFAYVDGDVNGNGTLDLGETWTYRVTVPWTDAEPGPTRTRTIVVNSLDPLVPNYQFPELVTPITLTR